MKSIDPVLDLGNGLTVATFSALIADTQQKLEAYNTALSTVDQTYQAILEAEQILSEYAERMLTGVASKYGRYSNEYIMAGGTLRRTARRRTTASLVTPTAPATLNHTTNGSTRAGSKS
jgi:uncharacterized protein YukE